MDLTPQDVAQEMKVNIETVRRLLRDRKLGHYKVGTEYRIPPTELERFKKARMVAPKL